MLKTSKLQLINLFENLGIKPGSKVFVHSSLFSLGLIEGGVKGFYDTLIEYLGTNSTLIVPTFTYSFRRSECFDVINTPSAKNIGVLAEYVRKHPLAIRSMDPLFSMASIGPDSEYLMQRRSHNCFGNNSIYELLFQEKVFFLAIGISYSTGITGFIHLENISNVPYRINNKFLGKSIGFDGKEFQDYAIHFVKDENYFQYYHTNRDSMGKLLELKGASKSINYAHNNHFYINSELMQDIVLSVLNKNPFSMLEKIHT